MPKLFTTLRQRYEARPGGYTRVLRTEPKSTYDQAPSAILEFVDGPKDMRFHMTAARVAKDHLLGQRPNKLTLLNRKKVTQFRGATGTPKKKATGKQEFNDMVERMKTMKLVSNGVDMLSVAAKTTRSPAVVVEKSPEKRA